MIFQTRELELYKNFIFICKVVKEIEIEIEEEGCEREKVLCEIKIIYLPFEGKQMFFLKW